eukprot:CAMPEP_0204164092 /NCGR_PEP_ID=MMETSP0361-20130328/36960_1 /ASSEMBLY_ACC=CAM_ASM_000343 /TAXON_ID=268821 /ORGANISM="Scrippsiella Hangoei, Strain SHTV-5" /LENGTH=37 /DNA_ID= /DNA_START= /DNA_END= /DNA_ORIENTATION=
MATDRKALPKDVAEPRRHRRIALDCETRRREATDCEV